MWLQGVGIESRARHLLVAGSYSSTVPRERCGWRGRMTGGLASGTGPAPPIPYTLPPTTAATARCRHGGQCPPAVRRRIVFPRIVDGVPTRRPPGRKVEAAEQIHFPIQP